MKIFYSFAQCLFCIGLIGCSNGDNVEKMPNSTEKNEDAGAVEKHNGPTYVVATEQSFPPYALMDNTGNISGYDTELIKAIAEKQGLNIKVKVHPWSDWPLTLEDSSTDIWMSGIAITPERQSQVDFTSPYLNRQTIAVVNNSNNEINSQNISNYRIAVQVDTPDYDYVTELTTGTDGKIVPVISNFLGLTALLTDKADVLLGNDKVIKYHLNQHPQVDFKIIPLDVLNTNIAFTVKKGRGELLDQLNEGFTKVKNDKALYEGLNNKWFGESIIYTGSNDQE